jgi:hypothetical protein
MKLTRFQTDGPPTPGLFLDDNTILSASSFGEDWNEAFFDNNGLARLADWLDQNRESAPTMQASEVTLAPAVASASTMRLTPQKAGSILQPSPFCFPRPPRPGVAPTTTS